MATRPPRAILVPIIILLNIAVFMMWMTRDELWMRDNFTVSWTGLLEGYYWTLLTSVFSHNFFIHIFFNMTVVNSFGSILEQILGRVRFLSFYLVAGIFASLTHALVSAFILHTPDVPALGASGALAGLLWVFALMFPKERVLLFFIIPLPAFWGALAFVGLDLWGLFAQSKGGGFPIGHGAHLGGAFAGVLYYWFYLRKRIRRRTA